jgi:hypothetical protein
MTFETPFLQSLVLIGLVVLEEDFCVYWQIRNRKCLWQPCLLSYQNEMKQFCRGPSKHYSYNAWFQLAQ